MRFYNPETTPPERIDSLELFPNLPEDAGARRCLKAGLLPSVTTVLHMIREDHLEKWLMREAITAGRDSKESPKDVVEALLSKESPNAKFGTDCHLCVEHHLLGKPAPDVPKEVIKHAAPALKWLDQNVKEVLFSELVLASSNLGAAGSVDVGFIHKDGRHVVGDLKVVKFSQKFPPRPGQGYKAQLSAYGQMLKEHYNGQDFARLSIYLASPYGWDKKPDLRIFWHNRCHLETFRAARTLWFEHATQVDEDLITINPGAMPKMATKPATWTPGK